MKKILTTISIFLCLLAMQVNAELILNLNIFTTNGQYINNIDVNLVYTAPVLTHTANNQIITESAGSITFYNNSNIEFTLSRIFFEDLSGIINHSSLYTESSENVSMVLTSSPMQLSGGNDLTPPFVSTETYTATPPPSKNGIAPQEYFRIDGLQEDISNALMSGEIRIGAHAIGFPDESSESGIFVIPEPSVFALLVMGGVLLLARRRI